MKHFSKAERLLKKIDAVNLANSKRVSKLWKLVKPSSEEEELAYDSISYYEGEISNLEILRWILEYREENRE